MLSFDVVLIVCLYIIQLIFGNDIDSTFQIVQASITWKHCKEIPVALDEGKSTVINGKVYCGGGEADRDDDNHYIIYCYDPSQDNWTTLPPLPVKWFGLGQVNGKLVAVGGRKSDSSTTNEVYTYDERSKKWKQTIPPMPTTRHSPGVLSLQSALVVAGGDDLIVNESDAVEIFKADTSQWYITDPLPTACRDISLVAIGNTCYALGGYKDASSLNQALYASVDDLLHNAVPANQTTHSGSSDTQSAWKTLPDTPTYGPAAAVLGGHLLTVGGKQAEYADEDSDKDDDEDEFEGADMKEVYTYSPSTNSWIYISDLPAPRYATAVAVLSPSEILVIGGWCGRRVNTVYKGTLHLKL